MKRIVRGNDFTMRIPVVKIVDGEKVAFPLPGCTDIVVRLCSAYRRLELAYTIDAKEDNVIVARVEGDKIPLGTYALEVRGKIFGNDWRSNEYEQVAIVDNNEKADTEFGETDEGENSVEMDTAVVVLPPDRELEALVKEAEETNANFKALDETVRASEEGRAKSEESRVQAELTRASNEAERVQAEQARKESEERRGKSEELRAEAETARAIAESERTANEDGRASTENARAEAEKNRNAAEDTRTRTEIEREANELTRKSNEAKRQDNETARQDNETARQDNEAKRKETEQKRENDTTSAISTMQTKTDEAVKTMQTKTDTATASMDEHRTAFDDAEATRVSNEQARVAAETARAEAESARVIAENARVTAENARTEAAAKAVADCEAASAGAERCNVTMEGSTITVTNRDGEQNTVDVVDTDEKVTVTIKSSVDSVKVSGITVSVYFNRDTKSPLKIVTDTGGKASFTAKRGEYYELKFPEYGAAQPIAPVGFTAVLPEREVSVTYMSYDKDNSEEVAITVARYPDGKYAAWANKEVKCTYDGNTTSFFTGTDGKVSIYVPLGKTYTITVDNEDGYSAQNGQNKISHTAELSYRGVSFFFYQYATGLWCVTEDGTAYTIDDWLATGRDGGEVVAIKFASYTLITHKGVFAFRTSDLTNVAGLTKTKWSSAAIFFPSIPISGYNSSLPYFYNGQDATTLIRQDAATLEVSADAADAACGQTLDIGGKTLRGFLPGGGQINMFLDNMVQLRDILAKIYGEDVSEDFYTNLGACWSCIQHATINGLWFNTNTTNYLGKGGLCKILPAFPL